jgi:phosphohistidine swiveling domain-containing protein
MEWRELGRLDADAAATWGGKAAGLARLLHAGAAVPAGFALPVGTAPPGLWAAADRTRFARAVDTLCAGGAVAVRSSALGEDGAGQSFAGIFETVLDVADGHEALAAVERCMASGRSERAQAYSGTEAERPVGVVVQRQVPARAAGVLFTTDPSGGGILLEAVSGLGEALVSGSMAPWRWRVDRSGDHGFEVETEPGPGPAPLTTEAVVTLAREALDLAQRLGEPLDLEWALDSSGRIWWLQARPITTLREAAPHPDVEPACAGAEDGSITVWTNVNVRETMPDPLAPLAWSLWRDRLMPAIARLSLDFGDAPAQRHLRVADRLDGRAYWNVNAVCGIPGFGAMVARAFSVIDARAGEAFADLQRRGIIRGRRFPGGRRAVLRAWLRAQRRALPALWRARDPDASLRSFEAFGAAMIERQRAPLRDRTDPELVAEIQEVTDYESMDVPRLFASLFAAIFAFTAARAAFARHPDAQARLGVGIPRNPTTRMSLDIDALAEAAAPLADDFLSSDTPEELFALLEESAEGIAWAERFRAFLDWNGQRCPGEFDLSVPRWSEDPEMLLELIRAHLREPTKEGARARLERLGIEREAAIDAAVAEAPAWRRPVMRGLARAATRHLPLREAGKHYLLFVFLRVRALALELGARMTAAGTLRSPGEILLLDLEELGDTVGGHLRGPALRRRLDRAAADLERWSTRPPVPFVRSDGVPVRSADAAPSADGVLRGAGVGTGTVTGTVRILREPDPAALGEGEILVVHLADPGWTPLFPRAGGLVMEVGGLLCHAAVVSRELGIPAVFGVTGALSQLADGQRVRVDSQAGTVTPL